MSQLYEILTVLSPHESEEDVDAIIGGLRQQITKSGGEVLAVDNWGKRKLAYPIRKFDEGTYVLMQAEGPTNLSADFRQHTRIRESILRELIVALDGAHAAAVRSQLEEKGPEDSTLAEAQIEAAEERAAEKLARVTAPVTDVAAAAAGVEVVSAEELEAPAAEEAPTADEAPAAEEVADESAEVSAEEAPTAEVPVVDDAEDDVPSDDAGEEE
ncbi:MAG: 30S ribosomal protein S6 [Acidobacteria bacterium]|nr:30S ribosomal protein S6 [Acidobacteriota bacterium]